MTFKTKSGLELPLLDLRGKEYLQVQHRVLWFRTEHPLGRIESEPVEVGETHSVFKATISIPDTSGAYIKLADGYKREDAKHFADHLEKASTGAIGRALALCGYGTQFAPEFDEEDRIVDAPVERNKNQQNPKIIELPKRESPPTADDKLCPACGHELMQSKFVKGELYCNKKTGGCGLKKKITGNGA